MIESKTPEYFPLENPDFIIILSGKRKCGKDYVAKFLLERLGNDKAVIVRLSAPLKKRYALEHGLDYEELLASSDYKERFRGPMIRWGESVRARDPAYFCRHALAESRAADRHVWIVSDARRPSDLRFFRDRYPRATRTVRLSAPDRIRAERGFRFTEGLGKERLPSSRRKRHKALIHTAFHSEIPFRGVDDCESECGLDDFQDFDFHLVNETHDQMVADLCKCLESLGVGAPGT